MISAAATINFVQRRAASTVAATSAASSTTSTVLRRQRPTNLSNGTAVSRLRGGRIATSNTNGSSTSMMKFSSIVGNFGDRPKYSRMRAITKFMKNNWKSLLGGTVVGSFVGQQLYGHTDNFYDYRFVTDADPADLQDFYGSENFMDIYCVMPFMGTLMMRGGYFDDDGVVHTTGLPGEMQVSMVFSDSEEDMDDDEDEDSTTVLQAPDGPPLGINSDSDFTGQWFNKRERFKDVFLGMLCWDMVTNFGFETLPDGRTMVYHHGEYFKGSIPPVSLLVRFVFSVHARWVAWATEHHINHYAFKNDTEFDEKLEHDSRVDMPLFLLKNYAWKDLMGAVFGRKLDEPSFLIKRSKEEAAKMHAEEMDEETEEDEETEYGKAAIALARDEVEKEALSKRHTLPVQKPSVQRHITLDIKMDRRNSRVTLNQADNLEGEIPSKKEAIIRRITSKVVENGDKSDDAQVGFKNRRFTSAVALDRYASMNRELASKVQAVESDAAAEFTDDAAEKTPSSLKRKVTVTTSRENLGGNPAWEALRSTNNPESYKAATVAAKDRFIQRRASMCIQRQASGIVKKHDVRALSRNKRKVTQTE
mmetsp:Transcript_54783/g.133023  ORF Transcript_54783/g.133023 Transcript_54783/m.133023 type:complete len:590 (+) Transcript_54783:340-2109(+)